MDGLSADKTTLPLEDLIVCPQCDAVYKAELPDFGKRAVCQRCHTVLIAPRRRAGMQIVALAVAILVLVIAATLFPFLRISVGGVNNNASIIDTALAFSGGPLVALSLAVGALIVLVPVVRVMLLLYVLIPVVWDRPPLRNAKKAFRLAEELKPWSMAEIFALGCAVALIKVADLAQIGFGPAFWMFAGVVIVIVLQDSFMCRWSVWKSLEPQERS